MDPTRAIPLDIQLAAANEWWRLAGVDLVFEDEPRAWLRDDADIEGQGAQPAQNGAGALVSADAPAPRLGGEPGGLPGDLAAFREWWLADPSLEIDGTGPRIAPTGDAGAQLMILVPMPESDDRQRLLCGKEGNLVASMIAAMGLGPESVYLASALPGHMADPDWPDLAQRGLGAVLRHHVALVGPERLLVLGRGIPPLLGHDPAQGSAAIKKTAIQAGSRAWEVPTLAGFAPDRLLQNARQRASLWRRWLDWTDA